MNGQSKFLDSVAHYLIGAHTDMSRLTLVFPNKRSAMFLKKYMQEALASQSSRPRFMPRFVTMGNFVSRFASRPEMPRLELLFLLYDCYRRLLTERGREEQLRDFDKFIFWGGMILDDFDDVDRQLVDAAKLFKNLKNLKEINADYLDDEQKRIVRQIWGDSARTAAVSEFWSHVSHVEGDSPEAGFVSLWQLLGELYSSFTGELHRRGCDTPGGQFRDALKTISECDREFLASRRYAFIGFNDLSHSELLMMKKLKDAGVAEFFWDFDSALLDCAMSGRLGARLAKLKQSYPMPDGFDAPVCRSLPQIEVIAVPSAIAQTKAVASILDEWAEDSDDAYADPIDTAIVLPDENLLTPLLLSIPESVPDINITMGVPFNATAFASMLHSVIALQLHSREIHGRIHYYYADVIDLLSHPHIQVIAPASAETLKRYISKNNLFNLDAAQLCESYPDISYLLTPVKSLEKADDICDYISAMIDGLGDALKANATPSQSGLPEIEMLEYFREGVAELRRLIVAYSITMGESTCFTLFERLMQSRRIDMQGTPLKGMQIMGVLETRALDFDNIIILSMNENSFPRKSYMRTMIPNNLRIGYGMNTIDRQDELYTYYFYRLLSRANRVKLIYDSRTGSFGAGEASRYIAQLRHIVPGYTLHFNAMQFPSDFNSPGEITVVKDREVVAHLTRFLPGGNAFLSASALKEYKKCRLRFYLRYVRNLRGEDNITDYISPSVYGTIVHKVVETLYREFENRYITADIITEILERPGYIDRVISEIVFSLFFRNARYSSPDSMPAEGVVTCSVISIYIRKMLEIERTECAVAPFRYIRGEMEVKSPPAWKISDTLSVNFKMSIDRVDQLAPGHLRFIDYKTGSDKIAPTTVEKLLRRERHDDDAVFQLMTYCTAYCDMTGKDVAIKPAVYPFRILAATGRIPDIEIDGTGIDDYRQVALDFREALFAMISEIFDPEVPFDQADDISSCTFCPFLDMCGRIIER